jgi:hypothetical protein
LKEPDVTSPDALVRATTHARGAPLMTTPPFPGLGSTSASSAFGGSGRAFPGVSTPAFPGLSSASGSPPTGGDLLGGASFPSPSGRSGSDEKPPVGLLLASVSLPALTAPLLFLDAWFWHAIGWAVAAFATAALLIAFTLIDTARRASAWYLGRDGMVRGLRLATIVLALLAAAAHSYLFADWFSRLGMFA